MELRDRGHDELHERIAACAQSVAAALLELPDECAPTSDPCHLLCDLHDCEGVEDCRDRCGSARAELDDAELRDIVARAASAPGACTCDLCDSDSAPFCAAVWDCSSG
ncbi:MAG: hypothetical protein ACOCUS_04540 [Polyangiales bacterium]